MNKKMFPLLHMCSTDSKFDTGESMYQKKTTLEKVVQGMLLEHALKQLEPVWEG